MEPVVELSFGSWLALSGECTGEQVERFLSTLTDYLQVETLAEADMLIVHGGLRLADRRTGAVVVPGCCGGLEDWRDWLEILDGGSPWLGHDPWPKVEIDGDRARVWQDSSPLRGPYVDVPLGDLAALLLGVQRDLTDFLELLEVPVARMVDRDFRVTAALFG
ncbi:hypothetical protein KZZ52_08635 [Dactylosporangium sp. AC04546]|uniref:hypothetical protein n=1 Tax=Dactylosporangium sp. AC04546 TaxID=2862460 RepID=UPI001EDE4137|nr:hypothetical protein [Dactylosporangium sp. AC04546]WVK85436.1 hypothetical protein KZZ52_08635 [Dactylosporangium sp. AC04546]